MRSKLLVILLALVAAPSGASQEPRPAAVAELFEDDADGLLKVLTNMGDGPGQGEGDAGSFFSGKRSLKITQFQRFNRRMPGWDFAIRGEPKPGEFRFLRLAWKSEGANSLMLQLHDATDWHIRYTAGGNPYGWQTRFVADKTPGVWTLVTIDLFKDFGERTLTGIAFTTHGGAGAFDHVYLGRTIDDLDRIDAGQLAAKTVDLPAGDLTRLWQDLGAADAGVVYRSHWRLVGGRAGALAFLRGKLGGPVLAGVEQKQLQQWIRQLDAEAFVAREQAMAALKKHLETAAPLLEAERNTTPSVEVRRRIDALLEGRVADGDQARRERARRTIAEIERRQREG